MNPKIQEIKQRAAPINYNNVSVNEFGELQERVNLLDQRIVEGYAVVWGKANEYREVFIKGAFSKSLNERGPGKNSNYEIKFLNQHNQNDPLGLFEVLKEDETGLYFKTKPLDDEDTASRVIRQLKKKTLNNFSIGFDFVWDQMEYDEKADVVIMKEARLFEISVVSIPADLNTYAIRSKENLEELHDDTDEFIKSLPRKMQLEARQLFARHKSLVNLGPLDVQQEAPEVKEPVEAGIDYQYLLQNIEKFI